MVPVRNGARPEAPEGGHSSQAGTVADPLDPVEAAPEPPPEEAPAVEFPDPEAVVEDAVPVAGKFTAP